MEVTDRKIGKVFQYSEEDLTEYGELRPSRRSTARSRAPLSALGITLASKGCRGKKAEHDSSPAWP